MARTAARSGDFAKKVFDGKMCIRDSGWPEPEDEIVEREYGSIRLAQTSLFSGE